MSRKCEEWEGKEKKNGYHNFRVSETILGQISIYCWDCLKLTHAH